MKAKLRNWIGGLAAASVVTTIALVGGASLVAKSSGQDVSFKARAGMRGVLDVDIRGTASGLVASEQGGKLMLKAPVANFSTKNAPRDSHLRSTLKAEQHPDVVLTVQRDRLVKLADGETKEGSVDGQISIAGKTATVPVKYRAQRKGRDYRVQAMFAVDLESVGIEPPCKGPVCVDPKVSIVVKKFELHDKP